MITRRWTPLFFVPTPVLRFVVGDVWWWVPFAMWLGGLVLLARYSVATFGLLGACLASLVIAFMWSLAGRVFLRMVRDAMCLRQSLPGVVGWRFQAIVDWIVPGGPSWTVVVHDDGRRPSSPAVGATRLRIWSNTAGEVRATRDRRWTAVDGGDCGETEELSSGDASELYLAAERFAQAGFEEWSWGTGWRVGPSTLLFRRGLRPRARQSTDLVPPESSWFWLWWALALPAGRRPMFLDPREDVTRVETRAGSSFSLGDLERAVRDAVGPHWEAREEPRESGRVLEWPERGLRVGFDAAGGADSVVLGSPACGGIWLPGDKCASTDFLDRASELLRALRTLATEQDLHLEIDNDAVLLPDLGVRFDFDGPLPLARGGELLLSDSWPRSDGDLPALVQITVERRVTSP